MANLNAKQKIFVSHYLTDRNATKAATACGYSAKTAGSAGCTLLKNPNVRLAVEQGLKRIARETEMAALGKGVTRERWVEELIRIGFSSIDDVALVTRTGKKGDLRDVDVIPTDERSALFGSAIKKISAGKYGPTVELHSKQAALETLGKAAGWIKDSLELSSKNGESIAVNLTMPANGSEAKPEQESAAAVPVESKEQHDTQAAHKDEVTPDGQA